MHSLLKCFRLHLFVVALNVSTLKLFRLVHLLVVVLHHLLVSFGIHRWLSKGLLAPCFLSLHDYFCFFVFASILRYFLGLIELLARPPEYRFLIIELNNDRNT